MPLTAQHPPAGYPGIAQRVAASAEAVDGIVTSSAAVDEWLDDRRPHRALRVERIPFDELDGWFFAADGGLRHRSGRFFTVERLHARGGPGLQTRSKLSM